MLRASVGELTGPVRMRKPCAARLGQRARCGSRPSSRLCRSLGRPLALDAGRAVRIVEIQDQRLGDRVGRAEAAGMLRIALHLDRPAHRVLDHDASAVPSATLAVA